MCAPGKAALLLTQHTSCLSVFLHFLCVQAQVIPFIAANNKNGDLPSPEVTVHSTTGVSAALRMLHTCGKLVSNKSLFLSIFPPL